MFGFDPLTVSSLLVMAASARDICPMPKPAQINVIPKTEDVKYSTSLTMAELQRYQTDTIDPYSFHGVSYTQGFMRGYVQMTPSVLLDYKHLPQYGAVCIWYDTIEIELKIDPTIAMAKEVAEDDCMRAAVEEHEMKHVMVDRRIVNKYAKIMGQKVYDALKERGGFMIGPVPQEQAQKIAERMQQTVFQITDFEYKKMDLERREAQQEVDNLEEYERVSALCPDFDGDSLLMKSRLKAAQKELEKRR